MSAVPQLIISLHSNVKIISSDFTQSDVYIWVVHHVDHLAKMLNSFNSWFSLFLFCFFLLSDLCSAAQISLGIDPDSNRNKNPQWNKNNKVTENVQHRNMLSQRSSVLQLRSNWLDIVNANQKQPFPSTQAGSARHSRGRISSRFVEWHQAFAGLQRDKCFCQGLGRAEPLQPKTGNKTRQKIQKN